MHRSLLSTLCCLLCVFATAQKTEWQARLGTGLSFFSGESATKKQTVYQTIGSSTILSQEYGKKPGLSITAGSAIQRITRSNWIIGTGLDFQLLNTSSDIDSAELTPTLGGINGRVKADGESKFKAACIAVSPFIGKQFGKFRITAGPEFAFFASSSEESKYKLNNSDFVNEDKDEDLNHPDMDLRLRFSVGWELNRFGLSVNYAKGLTNYYKGYVGANPEAYSNMIGIQVAYKLNK